MRSIFAVLQQSPLIIDKKAFANFENSIASKLGVAAAIITIGATVIGSVIAFLSLYTTMNFNKMEIRLKKEDEFDKK